MEEKSTYNLLKENFGILLTITIIVIASTMYSMGRVAENIVFDIVPSSQIIEKSLEFYIFSGSQLVLITLLIYVPLITFFFDLKFITIYKIILILFFFFIFTIFITYFFCNNNKNSDNLKNIIKKIEMKNEKFEIKSKLYYVYSGKDYLILKDIDSESTIFLNKKEVISIEFYKNK